MFKVSVKLKISVLPQIIWNTICNYIKVKYTHWVSVFLFRNLIPCCRITIYKPNITFNGQEIFEVITSVTTTKPTVRAIKGFVEDPVIDLPSS